jgi:predicted ATP-grasp superfamily ATP-dependent carboligase
VTGLATLRALHRAGIEISGFGSKKAEPGRFSRRAKIFSAPSPERDDAALCTYLLASAPRRCRPVLIPTSDAHLLFMSRYRAALETAYRFILPAEEVVEAMVDKRLQVSLALRHGVACPRTLFTDDNCEFLAMAEDMAFPAFLKPAHSHLWWPVFRNKGLLMETWAELEPALQQASRHGLAVILQQIVPGPATNHYEVCVYIGQAGEPLAVFTTRKLRQLPLDFGVGSLIEAVRQPELEHCAVTFLKAIGFKGIAAIEFKKHAESGAFLMIEVNGRLWSDHALALACGLNYPLLSYLDLLGVPQPVVAPYPEGKRWLDGANDLWASITLARRGALGPIDWLKSLSRTSCFAFLDPGDPLPLFWEMAQVPSRLGGYARRSFKRSQSIEPRSIEQGLPK